MRVVFDTNVLYAAFATKGFCEEVLDEAAGQCVIIWSEPLREEFEAVLARRHKVRAGTRAALTAYADLCEFVEPSPLPKRVYRDPDDDVVLATALAGRAEVIVTGDDDLLALKQYGDVAILSPRKFMELLEKQG